MSCFISLVFCFEKIKGDPPGTRLIRTAALVQAGSIPPLNLRGFTLDVNETE